MSTFLVYGYKYSDWVVNKKYSCCNRNFDVMNSFYFADKVDLKVN